MDVGLNKDQFILSIFFGVHDSCVTFSSKHEILLHLEAERIFRKKHIRVSEKKMVDLIQIGLEYLSLSIKDFDTLIMSKDDYQNLKFVDIKKDKKDRIEILGKYFFPMLVGHHHSHIGTIIPFDVESALIVCADGGSEDGFTKFYLKDKNGIKLLADFDDEVITGKFYGTITQMIIDPGLYKAHISYPGKLMGLAGFGEKKAKYYRILQKNGEEINKLHFRKNKISNLRKKFQISDKYNEPWLDENRKNLACTAQQYWEDVFMRFIKKYSSLSKNICLAGGCALNVNLNSRILESNLFEEVFIPPISSDCGLSLGAILYCFPGIKTSYPFLGRGFGETPTLPHDIFKDLLKHRIIAWYQGRSEIGPRALGHRSLIGLPDSQAMRVKLSEKIKKREPYRPVSPIILEEEAKKYFFFTGQSKYMNFAPKAKKITKKLAPAIVHKDGTSRIQTVSNSDNSMFYKILKSLKTAGRPPIIMNSSFNVAGEPIVDSPQDAFKSFKKSGADILFLNGRRIKR